MTASYGTVHLPSEATDAARALQRADQRMYAHKDGRPSSPRYQMRDMLLKALDEQQPALYAHCNALSALVPAVAQRLGVLGERELDDLTRAAELHDVASSPSPRRSCPRPAR